MLTLIPQHRQTDVVKQCARKASQVYKEWLKCFICHHHRSHLRFNEIAKICVSIEQLRLAYIFHFRNNVVDVNGIDHS